MAASECTGPLQPRSSLESCLAKRKSKLLGQTDSFQLTLEGRTLSLIEAKEKKRERNWCLKRKGKQRAAKETQAAPRRRSSRSGGMYVRDPLGSSM